jgi:hypothetical protein
MFAVPHPPHRVRVQNEVDREGPAGRPTLGRGAGVVVVGSPLMMLSSSTLASGTLPSVLPRSAGSDSLAAGPRPAGHRGIGRRGAGPMAACPAGAGWAHRLRDRHNNNTGGVSVRHCCRTKGRHPVLPPSRRAPLTIYLKSTRTHVRERKTGSLAVGRVIVCNHRRDPDRSNDWHPPLPPSSIPSTACSPAAVAVRGRTYVRTHST